MYMYYICKYAYIRKYMYILCKQYILAIEIIDIYYFYDSRSCLQCTKFPDIFRPPMMLLRIFECIPKTASLSGPPIQTAFPISFRRDLRCAKQILKCAKQLPKASSVQILSLHLHIKNIMAKILSDCNSCNVFSCAVR